MAWSSLAANQMVSEADAATGGFHLKSGQVHGTSNQCMSKDSANIKYELLASALSGYSGNQLIPKSAWSGVYPASIISIGFPYLVGIISPEKNSITVTTTASGNGSPLTQRRIYYSTTNNPPTQSDSYVSQALTEGNIETVVTGLVANTGYYFACYATNALGTGSLPYSYLIYTHA